MAPMYELQERQSFVPCGHTVHLECGENYLRAVKKTWLNGCIYKCNSAATPMAERMPIVDAFNRNRLRHPRPLATPAVAAPAVSGEPALATPAVAAPAVGEQAAPASGEQAAPASGEQADPALDEQQRRLIIEVKRQAALARRAARAAEAGHDAANLLPVPIEVDDTAQGPVAAEASASAGQSAEQQKALAELAQHVDQEAGH